ncbi:MAG: SUMF1/EgtB/PvdO family nonheme iron enzyme [Planctomycetes bacterium]|nr:SUMF1/EgtB/PvdO family nonheme iron enzyme [Planctomycetota bacterium]
MRPDANLLLLGSGNQASYSLTIPAGTSLTGVLFFQQAVVLDAGANAAGFVLSDAVEVVVGEPGWPLGGPPLADMRPVASGPYFMGSPAVGGTAMPTHQVDLVRPFWLGGHEVTQAEFQALMNGNPSFYRGPNLPVDSVSWNDAMAYCAALTAREAAAGRLPAGYQYRLPTEAEWEYGCRAGTTTEWNTGTSLSPANANIASSVGQTSPVGSYAANPWGLSDMHGNVWEWCLDSWDGSANYPAGPVSNPYVRSGPDRVVRGGGYGDTANSCRSARRLGYAPTVRQDWVGFRVALAPSLLVADGMVPIAAGTFLMGSPDPANPANERPVHTVNITEPFWIAAHEVTQTEYQALMNNNPSNFAGANRPVEMVSWDDARNYCAALTAQQAAIGGVPAGYRYRLPTEAEWEYCCRAGTQTEWNTGNWLTIAEANFGNPSASTAAVGSYPANPWGLSDMHGNVWEWCLDSWDGSANYPSTAVSDPYVTIGPYRAMRGGSWYHTRDRCRSPFRHSQPPAARWFDVGFRVVLAPAL